VEIIVNGKKTEVQKGGTSLEMFLVGKGFAPGKAVIEYNDEIVEAIQWKNIILKTQDRLEIVTFVGGG